VKLSYAFLADYAQVESGKVYVFGGGITVLWRPGFPAGLGFTVVASLAYNNTEIGSTRSFRIQINDADGGEIAPALEAGLVLPSRAPNTPSSVPLEAAFAVNLAGNIPIIPAPGNYVIEISVDGNHVKSLPFAALEMPAGGASQPTEGE